MFAKSGTFDLFHMILLFKSLKLPWEIGVSDGSFFLFLNPGVPDIISSFLVLCFNTKFKKIAFKSTLKLFFL
jgi:hypothetical protein